MSRSEDRHQGQRWLDTAEEDLRAARALMASDLFAHACFAAQQCGEKAVKALWYANGDDPWGHSIQKLIAECPVLSSAHRDEWVERGAFLDRFYIPTRYPNGLPDLTPEQSYFRTDAEGAVKEAQAMMHHCRVVLSQLE